MDGKNYLKDFRHQLLDLIEQGSPAEAVRFAADKVLQSYKNGLKAGTPVTVYYFPSLPRRTHGRRGPTQSKHWKGG
jgi:hypothetical protein